MQRMIARRVTGYGLPGVGTVEKWEPLGSGMCDALVRHEDGSMCWYASDSLRPADGMGSLPSRDEARRVADLEALAQLRACEREMIEEVRSRRPWPGAEFGKAILGKAIQGAIAEVEARL